MMNDNRKSVRIYPKDFLDYSVSVEWDGNSFNGTMGNISETGMCCILPIDTEIEKGDRISGCIQNVSSKEQIEYSGKVIWKDQFMIGGQYSYAIGIQFLEVIDLPDNLFALALAME